jgi:hypothetical protein
MASSQLSPRGSMWMGAFFIGCGLLPILMATGVITPTPTNAPLPPRWVPICGGLTFIAAGLAVIVDFGLGRTGPDGQLAPETPLPIQAASKFFTLAVVGLMAAIAGWIAFGSGPRAFTSTFSMPFYARRQQSGEMSGRIAFGVSTTLLVVVFLAAGADSVRQLWRQWRKIPPPSI